MTSWYVRKTGLDTNGGTSPSIRSTGTDGLCGTSRTISSASASWSSADIGHAVCQNSVAQLAFNNGLITAYTPGTTLTVTTSNGSTTVQSSALFNSGMVGQAISGPGIAAKVCITAFTDSSHVTINIAAGVGFGTGTATLSQMLTVSTTPFLTSTTTQFGWTVGGAWSKVAPAVTPGLVLGGTTTYHLAEPVAAGDTIYIGAGIYRETLSTSLNGSAGLPISICGDYDGTWTGDAGEVRITNYLADDKTSPTATSTAALALNTSIYLSFSWITLVGSTTGGQPVSCSAGSHDISFTDCAMFLQSNNTTTIVLTSSTTGIPLAYTFDRCILFSSSGTVVGITLQTTASGAGHWDASFVIRNCLIVGNGANFGINVTTAGSGSNKGGGVRVYGCTFYNVLSAVVTSTTAVSSLIPVEVHGSFISTPSTGLNANTLGQIVEDNNIFYMQTPRQNVAPGPGSVTSSGGVQQWAGLVETGQSYKWGGFLRPFLMPTEGSTFLAFGDKYPLTGQARGPNGPSGIPGTPGWLHDSRPAPTYRGPSNVPVPKVDFLGRQRPSGGRTTNAVGYLELHDNNVNDTVTYDVGPSSVKLTGPGDFERLVPLDAGSTTISVRCKYTSAYGSQNYPTVTLIGNGEIGVSSQVITAPGGAWGIWQTLTFAPINPTASGVVKFRFASRDDTGAGQVNFDTMTLA